MITLRINKDYLLPKCYKCKTICDIAITTSKKYPKKATPYCPKCAKILYDWRVAEKCRLKR
jgi:hypothetical protein